MKFQHLFVAVVAAVLAGCVTTPADVRKMEPEVFVAPENYQVIYRKIIAQVPNCIPWSMAHTNGDIYSNTKTATIINTAIGNGASTVTFIIDLEALNELQTKVVFYPSIPGRSIYVKLGVALRKWTLENSKNCD